MVRIEILEKLKDRLRLVTKVVYYTCNKLTNTFKTEIKRLQLKIYSTWSQTRLQIMISSILVFSGIYWTKDNPTSFLGLSHFFLARWIESKSSYPFKHLLAPKWDTCLWLITQKLRHLGNIRKKIEAICDLLGQVGVVLHHNHVLVCKQWWFGRLWGWWWLLGG